MLRAGGFVLTREYLGLICGLVAVCAAGAFLLWRYLHPRLTPQEIERRRRLEVNGKGKLGDSEVIDFDGTSIVYSYSVSGVGYTAAQDVTALEGLLPGERMSMIGPALVKFDPRNPANSIVLCEEWTGLRGRGNVNKGG